MAQNKTSENKNSVEKYPGKIPGETRRKDCRDIMEIMQKVAGMISECGGRAL